ncbi:Protein NUCLEAR FUSION DEFECTIVE 4 [Cardamine amara subsp. amara]|uniref:Protein NUCLEAR FUSION DEFECTIVE 4 n=1 Tax=Cardamine amara subsp. amara TaxID=228776 RepID=A0ABD1AWZ8_CARAN
MKLPNTITTTTTAEEELTIRKQPPSPPQQPRVQSMLQWWRRWTVLVAAIWIQAFTGTNFDFSAYSSDMKSSMGVSQSRLNYMAVASDLGKALGWSSGFAIAYFPVSGVLFVAVTMGLVGYGVQWLSIADVIDLPYSLVLVCCSLAGLSICWFNTVCFILCVRHFKSNHSLALSLVVSFNGISAALFTLGHEVISGKSSASSDIYLLLNSLIPLIVSILALWPVLTNPNSSESDTSRTHDESRIFVVFNVLALITCFYLLLPSLDTHLASSPRWHFLGAIFLLLFPLCVPFLDYILRALEPCFHHYRSGYAVVNIEEPKIHKNHHEIDADEGCDQVRLGEEHSLGMLVCSIEFWLYYVAYFCGGTIGLVYSNNLGQIAQSLEQSSSNAKSLVTLFSAFSFIGRLLSSTPDFTRKKLAYLTRTGWFTISLLPTPLAFFILAYSPQTYQTGLLKVATALIGLSSGFVFAAAVSITSDLFGRNSVGVNQNIVITNIPIGSLFYGYIAGSIYDTNASVGTVSDSVVCVGSNCYFVTFLFWGCFSVLGFVCSLFLFIRTRPVYHRLKQSQM